MKTRLWIAAAVLVAFCLPLTGDDGPEGKASTKAAPEDKTAEIVARLTGPFAEIATAGKVNEKQAKSLLAVQAAMEKAVAQWEQSSQKKIAAAEKRIEKTKNSKTKARMEKDLAQLKAGRGRLEAIYWKKGVATLSPAQRGEYFGPKLWSAISREFAAVNLDEAQTEKALNICKRLTQSVSKEPTADQALKVRAYRMIAANVLTKEQKAQLARKGKAKTGRKKSD